VSRREAPHPQLTAAPQLSFAADLPDFSPRIGRARFPAPRLVRWPLRQVRILGKP